MFKMRLKVKLNIFFWNFVIWILLCLLIVDVASAEGIIPEVTQACFDKYQDFEYEPNKTYCGPLFDNYLCWPPTVAGQNASQHCPKAKFSITTRFAHRRCGLDGSWLGRTANEAGSVGWTNYTLCFPKEIQSLFYQMYNGQGRLKLMIAHWTRYLEISGFTSSLITLSMSFGIFIYFWRALYNNRTRIHLNLFAAMMLQVIIRLILYIDQERMRAQIDSENTYVFDVKGIDDIPYLCEMFYVLLEYSITVEFLWMFIEGLHLNSIVTGNVMNDWIPFWVYNFIGWGLPAVNTLIWAAITAAHYNEDTVLRCWYGYNFAHLYWILQGPRFLVIGINLLFLLNIMRVLITKLRDNQSTEIQKARKAVKAAFFLLQLLGITNLLDLIEPPLNGTAVQFGFWSFGTHFLKSFQGCFIPLIYCFLNTEVRCVVLKFISNRRAMRESEQVFRLCRQTGPHPNTELYHFRFTSKGRDIRQLPDGHTSNWRSMGELNSVQPGTSGLVPITNRHSMTLSNINSETYDHGEFRRRSNENRSSRDNIRPRPNSPYVSYRELNRIHHLPGRSTGNSSLEGRSSKGRSADQSRRASHEVRPRSKSPSVSIIDMNRLTTVPTTSGLPPDVFPTRVNWPRTTEERVGQAVAKLVAYYQVGQVSPPPQP